MIKPDKGCPIGFYNVILWDKARTDLKKDQYGYLSWYSNHMDLFNLPDTLQLITKNKSYNYPIRSGGGRFYVIHKRFWNIARKYKTNFRQVVSCEYTDSKNNILSSDYLIGVTNKLSQNDAISNYSTDSHKLSFGFEKISINSNLEYDLFDIQETSHQFSLIVSEKLKEELEKEKIVGLDFYDVSTTTLLTRKELDNMDINQLPRYEPV